MMKKYKLLFLIAFILLFMLSGCKKEETNKPSEPTKPDIEVVAPTNPEKPEDDGHKLIEIKDDKGQTALKVTYFQPNLKEYVSADALENISAYYDRVYTKKNTYWKQELADTALEQMKEAEKNGDVFSTYTVDESFEITGNTDYYISVKRTSDEFIGGAHSNQAVTAETFLKSNGALLLLSDMFTVDAQTSQKRLLESVRATIEGMQKQGGTELFANAADLAEQTFDPTNFFLTSDGIVLFYPTYAIGPFSEGNQYFEIKFSELSDILKSDYTK